jgi:hypothetical protein
MDLHRRRVADCLKPIYDPHVIDELRAAVDALNDGDVGPFIALLDDECEWRAVPHGHLWWKNTPS